MNKIILEKLSQITEEERLILNGGSVDKSIYTDGDDFTVKSSNRIPLITKGAPHDFSSYQLHT